MQGGEPRGERPQRARDRDACDGVGGQSVQDRPIETGALSGLRIDVQRIPVAREAIDQRRARIDGECRRACPAGVRG